MAAQQTKTTAGPTPAKKARKPRTRTEQQVRADEARKKADAAEKKFAETKSSKDETEAVEARNVANFETQRERRENFERVFGTSVGAVVASLQRLAKACSGRKYLFVAEDEEALFSPIRSAIDDLQSQFQLTLQRDGRSTAPRDRRVRFAPLPIAEPERPASRQIDAFER